ncbi:anthranilate synthase, component I [Halobacillus karajensis]|uniref:Anthranilate synthase component 1 n=1 Tax=Halobacillus karajensis TaxID=195088 RepID=A0A024P5R2_9BACI|nr:anthranilate synthase component I [Halobacillus karajensis]CDQ20418.1 Anthranilate synthase component 1 [Halobacillus karajensis]CDQ24113.1 Anthranilate synthase component 1 [Halobacillus karajensis]CDQ27591.1 Anthranilate synthase component 1 [Halobacillus karajensis]SEH91957.1 anthranilate synthase, component I [Halobacillus karajensis]
MTTFDSFQTDAKEHRTIPITQSFFTDTLTPIHMFHALKEEAVYMLESQDPESPWSNFSFIGLDPMIQIKEVDRKFQIEDFQHNTIQDVSDFKTAYEKVVEELGVKQPPIDLPFKGGGVGYISYDAISDYEPVDRADSDDLNLSNYHLLFCQTLIAYDHKTKETTILSFARKNKERDLKETYTETKGRIKTITDKLLAAKPLSDLMLMENAEEKERFQLDSNYEPEKFRSDVEKVKEYIRAGDIFQAVLSQRFHTLTNRSGFELYRVLRRVNPSPYMFYLKMGDVEVIGSSPERLLEVQNGKLEIHPIAGTRKRGNTKEEDDALAEELLADEKELAEHRMLVDLARNDIGRVAEFGTVKVSEYMTIGRFSKVMHIISKVTGQLKETVSPIDALISSFPAGTLSGAPKVRAMQILRELEPTPRNLYGGGILYLGFDGNIDSCITIRTMTLTGEDLYIQAGAGIVADSDPEAEYQETLNKASALKKTIQLAEQVFEKSREGVETR